MDLREELTGLERRLAAGDPAAYREICRGDAVFLMPGMVVGLDEAVAGLEESGPWDGVDLVRPDVRPLGDDAAVLFYRFTGRRGSLTYTADMASSYVRQGGRWWLVTHQQTPV